MAKIDINKVLKNIDNMSLDHFSKHIPTINDRNYYDNIDSNIIESLKSFNKSLQWNLLLASDYAAFEEIGSRAQFEDKHFERRNKLATLTMLECNENKGKYMKDIIDGIYLICEEVVWFVPAHKTIKTKYPSFDDDFIDLFSAETGVLLSWVYYLLDDKLPDEVRKLIEYKVKDRILNPYRENDAFWWMWDANKDPKHNINNWTPWVISNILICSIIFDSVDETTLTKIINSLNVFLSIYKDDASCNEGSRYYEVSVLKIFYVFVLLEYYTDGKLRLYEDDYYIRMAEYIVDVNLFDDKYYSYADSTFSSNVNGDLLKLYSYYINSDRLYDHAIKRKSNENFTNMINQVRFSNLIIQIIKSRQLNYSKFNNIKDNQNTDTEFINNQIFIKRNLDKFTLGIKGGSNKESHNHNDLGSFIIFYKKNPVFLDLGVGVYTKQTFSDRRYELVNMQSCYHNLPTINGIDQLPGIEYYSKVIRSDMKAGIVELDLSNAYNTDLVYRRSFNYYEDQVKITDYVKCEDIILNYTLQKKPIINNNEVTFDYGDEQVIVEFDFDIIDMKIEEIDLSDDRILKESWGNKVYRLRVYPKKQTTYKTTVKLKV